MRRLLAYLVLVLVFILPAYVATLGATLEICWLAILVSATIAIVTSTFVSLRQVIPNATRALPGCRGIVSYVQVPLAIAVSSIVIYRSLSHGVPWGWFGLFLAALLLGNPAQMILASGAPGKLGALVVTCWLLALGIVLTELFREARQERIALLLYTAVLLLAVVIYRSCIVEIVSRGAARP